MAPWLARAVVRANNDSRWPPSFPPSLANRTRAAAHFDRCASRVIGYRRTTWIRPRRGFSVANSSARKDVRAPAPPMHEVGAEGPHAEAAPDTGMAWPGPREAIRNSTASHRFKSFCLAARSWNVFVMKTKSASLCEAASRRVGSRFAMSPVHRGAQTPRAPGIAFQRVNDPRKNSHGGVQATVPGEWCRITGGAHHAHQ